MVSWWILTLFSIILAVSYLIVIVLYLYWWSKIPVLQLPKAYSPKTRLSIIIPARNEENSIGECLNSILSQSYPTNLIEVFVIDDHSTDQTKKVVENFNLPNIHIIELAQFVKKDETKAFKKKAIEIGVSKASGEIIVTTDADCVASPDWLLNLVAPFELSDALCVAGPVNFHQETNVLERFQSLDFLGMMLITGAGIQSKGMRLGNGANLAYTKAIFKEVNGFEGVKHLASGDDLFLIQKIAAKYPDKIHFLKNRSAVVFTMAKPTWEAFFQQRLRWATKNGSYQEWTITLQLAIVFFCSWGIITSLILVPFVGEIALFSFVILFLTKSFADYVLLYTAGRFFDRLDLMSSFLRSQVYHIFYIAIIGLWANLKKEYEWKGRTVR